MVTRAGRDMKQLRLTQKKTKKTRQRESLGLPFRHPNKSGLFCCSLCSVCAESGVPRRPWTWAPGSLHPGIQCTHFRELHFHELVPLHWNTSYQQLGSEKRLVADSTAGYATGGTAGSVRLWPRARSVEPQVSWSNKTLTNDCEDICWPVTGVSECRTRVGGGFICRTLVKAVRLFLCNSIQIYICSPPPRTHTHAHTHRNWNEILFLAVQTHTSFKD